MSKGLKFYIVFLLIGIVLTAVSAGDAYRLMSKDPAKLETKTLDNFKVGEMVEGEVQYIFDTVATLETSKTMYGIPYSKEETPYYLVMVTDKDDIVQGYVIMHINNKDDIKKFDNLQNSTQDMLFDENVVMPDAESVQTKTEEMPDDLKKYVYDYFIEGGMTKAECDELVADCVLEQKSYKNIKIMPAVGIGIIIVATVIFIIAKVSAKKSRSVYVNEIPSAAELHPGQDANIPGTEGYQSRYGDAYKAMENNDNQDDFLGSR